MITVTISITATATFVNSSAVAATGASPPADPNPANNTSSWTVTVFSAPLAPVQNVQLSPGGAAASPTQVQTLISWSPPSDLGGCTTVSYDVLRSPNASDFTTAAVCLATSIAATQAEDSAAIQPGEVFFYLIRAKNECGSTLGTDSTGTQRSGKECS
jgi:hypothetical protein